MIVNIMLYFIIIMLVVLYIGLNQNYKKICRKLEYETHQNFKIRNIIYNSEYTNEEKIQKIQWELEQISF